MWAESKYPVFSYPQVVLLNCVWIVAPPPSSILTHPFPLPPLSSHMVQCTRRAQSQTPHLPMSLAAKSPSRDLLKWNIRFHFEVPKLLNHLARKDAARVVKLLCLAAGSPSADRTPGIREVSSARRLTPSTDITGSRHCLLLCFNSQRRPNGMLQ